MECLCVNEHKSWLYSLSIFMIIPILMVRQTEGVCIEEERKALLEIKASLVDSYVSHGNLPLPSWVDRGSTGGRRGGECCDWERVNCSTTSGHITNLSLSSMMRMVDEDCTSIWPLNVSLFLNFKNLRSHDLSVNCLDNGIVTTGIMCFICSSYNTTTLSWFGYWKLILYVRPWIAIRGY